MPPRRPVVDYHVHTARCGHAVGPMEAYVEAAIASGIEELGFSDHLYLYWLPPNARDHTLAMADWELDAYVDDVERCRARYKKDIQIRLSTEADYVPGHESTLASILRRYDWDYVIGSVHFLDGWGFDDSRYVDGFQRWDLARLYERYFDLVAATAESGQFEVIGHVDLIKKYGHRPGQPLAELYERLAERLARARVCVEVNTAGLRKPCAETYPHPDLLAAIRRAGVTTTFASDAHDPQDVASDLAAAERLMWQAGYREYQRFSGRRAESVPLANSAVSAPGRAP